MKPQHTVKISTAVRDWIAKILPLLATVHFSWTSLWAFEDHTAQIPYPTPPRS